ncbi:MAG: HAMP domain-containing sensor histidine kinase, partial [Vampirovibrionales bacterium]|nr:HAMP domain-containing sensor histidine kinase [Vampirovibrionales bacterium]
AADLTVNAGDLEPGHLAPEPTLDLLPLTLAPFIAAQVAALQPVALQQGLNLKYTCRLSPEAVDALTVRVDRTALAQVILNLVKNAFEACKAKAEDDTPLQALPEPAEQNKAEPDLPDVQPDVYLLLEQHGAFVRLTIQDTGCGADAGLQKKMCSPGFTSKVSGSGIGLWHSQRLVQAMGGRLQFESPGRGKGATVTLQLPVFVSY